MEVKGHAPRDEDAPELSTKSTLLEPIQVRLANRHGIDIDIECS